MESKIVSEEQCKEVLRNYMKRIKESADLDEIEEEVVLSSSSVRPISNQLDGFIGEQFFLTLVYRHGSKHKQKRFFVKIISKSNPVMYKIAKEILAFEKESFFYEKYIPYLKEEGFDCDYVAKSYLSCLNMIVLEDLDIKSYKSLGKNITLDLKHCKVCLKTLAKFHTDSILFELKKTKDLAWEYKLSEAFPEIFKHDLFGNSNSMVIKYYQHSVSALCRLFVLIPEHSVESEKFKNTFIAELEKIPSLALEVSKKFRTTISHNDLWCNNILYKYSETKELQSCKIIDFQTIMLKPPIYDVLGFLFMNTTKIFRDEHLKDLLAYYYNCFYELIELGGHNPRKILTKEEFWASYDYLKLTIKLHATIDRSFTLIPEEVYINYSRSEEMFSHFVFEGRGEIITEVFKNHTNYKEAITEDLCELRSMLF